jgi:hypothetical protein
MTKKLKEAENSLDKDMKDSKRDKVSNEKK